MTFRPRPPAPTPIPAPRWPARLHAAFTFTACCAAWSAVLAVVLALAALAHGS